MLFARLLLAIALCAAGVATIQHAGYEFGKLGLVLMPKMIEEMAKFKGGPIQLRPFDTLDEQMKVTKSVKGEIGDLRVFMVQWMHSMLALVRLPARWSLGDKIEMDPLSEKLQVRRVLGENMLNNNFQISYGRRLLSKFQSAQCWIVPFTTSTGG